MILIKPMDVQSYAEVLGEIHNTVKTESEAFINTLCQTRSDNIVFEFETNLKTKKILVLL